MATLLEQAVIEIQVSLRAIDRRMAEVERRLGIAPEAFPPKPAHPLPPEASRTAVVTHQAQRAEDPYEIARPAEESPPEPVKADPKQAVWGSAGASGTPAPYAMNDPPAAASTPASVSASMPVPPAAAPQAFQPRAKAAAFVTNKQAETKLGDASLERAVGTLVASWVGALVVLGGMLFFLKYAWDQGWLYLTPAQRIGLGLGAGGVMVVLGEWLHLRKLRPLSAAVAGAGLAVLMASFFAGNVAFMVPVFSRETAFIMVMGVGALGIALSLHMNVQTLTALSLTGMYLSPAILSSGEDKSLVLLTCLLAITVPGLVISILKERWETVRVVVFLGVWGWMLGWVCFGPSKEHMELGIVVLATFFFLFQAEMVASLARMLRGVGKSINPMRMLAIESSLAALSLVTTAFAVLLFFVLFDRVGNRESVWTTTLGMAGVMTIAALLPPAKLRSKYFMMSAGIQAMGLLVLAVPQYFDRVAVTGGWAVLGMVLAIYAYFTNSGAARVWMFALVAMVAARVIAFDSHDRDLTYDVCLLGSEHITRWMLLGWGTALYAGVIAWLSRERTMPPADNERMVRGAGWASVAASIVGSVVMLVAGGHGLSPDGPLTFSLTLWAFLLMTLALQMEMEESTAVEVLSIILLYGLSLKWIFFDGLLKSLNPEHPAALIPLVNLFVCNGILIALAASLNRTVKRTPGLAAWWMTVMGFVALNIETVRAVDFFMRVDQTIAGIGNPWIIKNVSLSVLWGLVGFSGVIGGFARKVAHVRWVALALLGFTVMKVLLVDMANVQTILRVFSFLVVGGLLLLVSYVYHKVVRAQAI